MTLDNKQLRHIDDLVVHFKHKEELFNRSLGILDNYIIHSKKLKPLIHTKKFRVKDPDHLRGKLIRKTIEAQEKGEEYVVTVDNLFHKINDLAGFRIIHLHTHQVQLIDEYLKEILLEERWEILEGPEAKTWDDESAKYFESIGFNTVRNRNMYTSVHYVVKPNATLTCEIQVRTLMEEVWGEVDHSINYPNPTSSLACREQIKVLARITSSCSRLVDSIFSSHAEYEESVVPRSLIPEKSPTRKKAQGTSKKVKKKK